MASALALVGDGIWNRQLAPVTPASALGIMLADTAVGFGGSVALGEVYARYGEGNKWYNKVARWAPEILGGVGKLIEGLLLAFVGPGFASGIAGSLGQVGVNAVGLNLGLDHARKAMGIVCVKVPAGTDARKIKRGDAVPAGTAVGALPQAEAGHGLAWDHIQDLAQSH